MRGVVSTIKTGLALFALLFVFAGCNVPMPISFGSSSSIKQLKLPTFDSGYANLQTRVIETKQEYKAFLSDIDSQSGWDKKVAFGINIGKQQVDFSRNNLMIYRHYTASPSVVGTKLISSDEKNATIEIIKKSDSSKGGKYHAFFYEVSKKIKQVTFKGSKKVVTVQNSRNKSAVPKECIAWFDGCNHCIRSADGRSLCTKRYCKTKGEFKCIKWK